MARWNKSRNFSKDVEYINLANFKEKVLYDVERRVFLRKYFADR
ncbi:hypothetical protein CHY_0346 [Carboxydothermus hydrogenoformans Z-2901]|uniref:Uncharacterized protein n=1 Tax=Carboxydothermus hydrogenoformans (strain ATCC BAA-161 / DSM 6008 / Z-2901) TaxID=246194 RepID=Q3AF75_CARHZ|nr:hypothetical protein CHY_0346 [Carboxydothermus hydrogenoformans Z-2901]